MSVFTLFIGHICRATFYRTKHCRYLTLHCTDPLSYLLTLLCTSLLPLLTRLPPRVPSLFPLSPNLYLSPFFILAKAVVLISSSSFLGFTPSFPSSYLPLSFAVPFPISSCRYFTSTAPFLQLGLRYTNILLFSVSLSGFPFSLSLLPLLCLSRFCFRSSFPSFFHFLPTSLLRFLAFFFITRFPSRSSFPFVLSLLSLSFSSSLFFSYKAIHSSSL